MRRRANTPGLAALCLLAIAGLLVAGCEGTNLNKKPSLLLTLPDDCNTPDGAALDAKGNVTLSIPNFNNNLLPEAERSPATIVKITPDNKLSLFYDFKDVLHPDTKKVGPMGQCYGPDGNLYVADNQFFFDKNHKSRLLRVNIKDGKAVGCDVVVDGFIVSNGVTWHGDTVYVTETTLDPNLKPMPSGIYAFKLSELKGKPVQLKPWAKDAPDPHLIATLHSSGKIGFGADGITFDSKGNLYCAIFEDGVIHKITLDDKGHAASDKIWAKSPNMKCCDGIYCDKRNDYIYVADMVQNAVQRVSPKGQVVTVWKNGDTDGTGGLIDQPCEVILRGDELIVVNMDMPFEGVVNKKFDKPYTLSVIKVDDPLAGCCGAR